MAARTGKALGEGPEEVVVVGTLSDIGPCYTRLPPGVFVSGRSAAWIARTVRVREVGSSNLPAPTIL